MREYGWMDVLRFYKRELFQQIWLPNKLMHVYEHGVKLLCGHGTTRHVCPCIFTYSMNYG